MKKQFGTIEALHFIDGSLGDILWKQNRSFSQRQADRQGSAFGERYLVGTSEFSVRRTIIQNKSSGASDYLSSRVRIYVVDGCAGWDPEHRLKIRVICSRPYHALFIKTMLIRPDPEDPDQLW
jgi:Phosphoenolpyruvate carboxykinase